MQVSASPGSFSGWIHPDAFRRPHDPDEGALGKNFPAAHTSALWYMFGS